MSSKASKKRKKPKDLVAMHNECAGMLVAATKVAEIFKSREILTTIDDLPLLIKTGKELIKELKASSDTLINIEVDLNKVRYRSGELEQMLEQMPIVERYKQWAVTYTERIAPLLETIDVTCSKSKEETKSGD